MKSIVEVDAPLWKGESIKCNFEISTVLSLIKDELKILYICGESTSLEEI